jgi:hypothetical protein
MRSQYREALDYLYGFTDYEKLSGYTYSAERFNDDIVCTTGSLFVVAELRAAWFKHKRQPLPPSDTE